MVYKKLSRCERGSQLENYLSGTKLSSYTLLIYHFRLHVLCLAALKLHHYGEYASKMHLSISEETRHIPI